MPRRWSGARFSKITRPRIAAQIVELQQAHALLTHKIANYKKIEQRIRIGGPMPRRARKSTARWQPAS